MSFSDAQQFWNKRFDRPDYLFGTAPNKFLASQKRLLRRGQIALSIADGEGRNSVWLAEQGIDVVAVELSNIAVDKARRLAAQRGVAPRFEIASILDWEWGEARFDVIAAIFFQFASPAQRSVIFRHIVAALKLGGLLILQGYTPRQVDYKTGGPPSRENMYTETLLREAFAELDIMHLHEHDDILAEGAGHDGRSAVIDMVAIRPQMHG